LEEILSSTPPVNTCADLVAGVLFLKSMMEELMIVKEPENKLPES
jgi:hypothetical protein